MPTLRELMAKALVDGRLNTRDFERLAALLYAKGKIDRAEAEFLVELHQRIEQPPPGFDAFFVGALRDHVLTDGRIDSREANWLRAAVFAEGRPDEREERLLREIKSAACETCPEFEALLAEFVRPR